MKIECYRVQPNAPKLVAGTQERKWMDETPQRFAYRCLPLTMANSSGWSVLSPCRFSMFWNGGEKIEDIRFVNEENYPDLHRVASSHFGSGVVTFFPGYLFKTPPGWALWARGAPNWPKDGIIALDGLVETDWLNFTFTMNWLFTRPGKVTFEKDEPFCFITPVPHGQLDSFKPEISNIVDHPELVKSFQAWSDSRDDFNRRLHKNEPVAVKEGWQRHYLKGVAPDGQEATFAHRSKRRLATPKDIS